MNGRRPLRYLNVFVVEEYDSAEGEKARRWIRVGAAFPHAEGPGFNLELQCLPRDGKLVVLAPNEDETDPQSDLPLARAPDAPPRLVTIALVRRRGVANASSPAAFLRGPSGPLLSRSAPHSSEPPLV